MVGFRRILVLCTGNICRSPLAEAILRQNLGNDFYVESAGLGALVGHGADPFSIATAKEIGLDLETHRAQQVSDSMLRASDLVLVMTTHQKTEVETLWPWTRGKVWRIGHWEGFDVDDPYQNPLEAFKQARQFLETSCRSWATRLSAGVKK